MIASVLALALACAAVPGQDAPAREIAPVRDVTPVGEVAPAETAAPPPRPAAPTAAPPVCVDRDSPASRRDEWRRVASDADRTRLRNWHDIWTAALPVGGTGAGADATLFAPDRALADALPPLGSYRCRLHRFGRGMAVAPVWGGCRIEEDKGVARFVVEDGVQRPAGHFYPDTASRAVFLGTVLIGDEARPLRYGRDRLRDLAGFVERVDERRWRVAFPRPSFGGELDLIELVPE